MATNDFVVKNGLDVTEAAIIRATTDSSNKDTGALVVEGGIGIEKNLSVGVNLTVGGTAAITGNTTLTGDIAVNGGDITTNQTTFNLIETTATTLNVGGASTTLNLGATSGTTNVRNNLNVTGDLDIDGGDLTASTTTFNLINATATTLNIGGAATSLNLGAVTGTLTVRNSATVFSSTNSIQIPVGTTSQRSGTPAQGQIRYNSQLSLYEGYGAGNQWNSLGGVRDVDGDTYILAELTPASNDNTLFFYAGGVNSLSLTSSLLDVKVGTTLSVANATEASSSTTGAVQIAGGVGIAKRLYVGGGIQNTAIGSSVANTAAFTSLTANGAVTFTQNTASTTTSTGTLVVSGGVGVTGAVNAGLSSTFNGLSSTNTTLISPANAAVTISPTGTGTVTIAPATLGTINNMSIGATTASTGRFTNTTITGTLTAGGVTGTNGQVLVSTGTGIQWATSSSIANGTSNVSVALNGNITITRSGTLITTFSNTNVNIPVSTASSSTSTGALTVTGGVGIGGQLTLGGNLITAGLAAFGTTSIDPDSYASYSGGFGNIADGSGWGSRGLFVHGGGAGDAAAIGHNGSGLYFGIQNGTAADSMTSWLEVTPARAISFVNGTGFTYNANTIWHAGNDGAGSGLDADLLDGFSTSQAAAGTTIPVRDSSGYLYGNYINMSDNSQTTGVTAIICKAGDNFYRSATAAATATFLSGQTMNIAGSATSLATSRTFTIGNTARSFNGTADVSWTQDQIGGTQRYSLPNTGGASGWIRLGTFAADQNGRHLTIRITSGTGYNANPATNAMTFIHFKTSNGSSANTLNASFFADGHWYRVGPANTPSTIRVAQLNVNSYEFWGNFGSFTGEGGSFYEVAHGGTSWTHSGTNNGSTPPGGTTIDLPATTVAASYFSDPTRTFNVNLGSGGSEGRGAVAGYSGGNYGGIGYNIRHTESTGVITVPLADTASYIRFDGGGFTFLGDSGTTAGRGFAYTTRMTLNASNNLTVVGTITEQSSIVYKENVNPIDNALDKVLKLVGVTYDRKDGTKKNEPGLIAESVAEVIPSLVERNEEGNPNSISYSKLTAYLVECIKELNAKIERLEGKS
jgi:hypothetical protein